MEAKALFEAIIRSVDELKEEGAPARNNILIAPTDGVDQDSNNSLADALDWLNQSSVTLFVLVLSEPGVSGDYDDVVLEELTNATVGAAYAADTRDLHEVFFPEITEIDY